KYLASIHKELTTVSEAAVAAPKPIIETGTSVGFTHGEAIPDVLRPYLPEKAVFSPERMTEIGEQYPTSLQKIAELPRTRTAAEGENAGSLAERLLKERAPLSGERVSAEALGKETTRLEGLNPSLKELTDWGGQSVAVHTDESLAQVGKDAMF